MKKPLVVIAVLFSLGIFASNHINISFAWSYILTIIFLILALTFARNKWISVVSLSLLVFSLGVSVLKNSMAIPKSNIFWHVFYRNSLPCAIKGFVCSEPLQKNSRLCFVFSAREITYDNLKYRCCGEVFVSLKTKKDLSYGEELILPGNLYRTAKRGRDKTNIYMNVKLDSGVLRLNTNNGLSINRLAVWLKQRAIDSINRYASGTYSAIMKAMVLGEKTNVPPAVYDSMIKSGTIHILVVSGFNVGLVFFIVNLLMKLLRVPRHLRLYAAVPLLILYCLITGASTPVVRATIMSIIFILAHLSQREPDIYNSCAIAAISILAFCPKQLFDAGFQLSFTCVISIVWLYPKIKALLGTDNLKIKLFRFLTEGLLISFSCWLGTAGFIIYYFKMVTTVSILANIFIVPLASLITLSSFCLLITAMILPCISGYIALSCGLFCAALLKINAFFIQLPGAYFHLK